MLCNRLRQFREYNEIEADKLAQILKISPELYKAFESGREKPTIDIIEKLTLIYKVSLDEFYGYTPRLEICDKNANIYFDDDMVDEKILKLSALSWEETQLILYFRTLDDPQKKEDLIKDILKDRFEK